MHKTWLIIKREYLSRVRKKSFIVITLLVPVIFILFIGLQVFLASGGNREVQHIAVIDETGQFRGKLKDGENIHFSFVGSSDPSAYRQKYARQGYTGLLFIPRFELDKPEGFTFYGQNQLGLGAYSYITGQLDHVIEQQRMVAAGIDQAQLDAIKADVSLIQAGSGGGDTTYITYAATAVGYIAGFMIYFVLLFFGMQVMRGVMEEKTNRIAEVIISSVKPFQLMAGKIVGIAGVGLTQFLIWLVLGLVLFFVAGALAPGLAQQAAAVQNAQPQAQQAAEVLHKVHDVVTALPVTLIIVCFLFYFLGGYLLYASLYAAVGSAVDHDAAESQSLTFPLTLPLILSFFIMFNAIQQPNSPLSVGASLFPLSSPLVMIVRIPFGVPWWQLALSMLFLVLGFLLTTWIAAKIYRTGILLYGKKVTLREMGKWLFRKG
ncbi:ABC transporter permease [Compostibacter hankyongensis]|uniref:ABC transporter permease n=1 Tax=Compostibacter hankyongensis TaxID=1007089 RepID=A0ABP8G942_9BACT